MPYKLFVLPSEQTKEYLRTRFADLSVQVDYDKLCVELGSSHSSIKADLTRTYRALPGSLGIWYETATARSWVILPLIPSPEMCDRREEVGDVWQRKFLPYMVLSANFNNTPHTKPRLNSIATGLVDTLPEFTFSCETVLFDEAEVPSQADFYDDYLKTGVVNRQLFVQLSTR